MTDATVESPKLVTSVGPAGYEVRTFADGKLQADIDAALAKLPSESNVAVLIQADLAGAKVVVGRNKGPWTVAAIAEYDWKTKNLQAGAEVIFHF